MKVPFKSANILIPKNTDMTKWSVVACDQYTSEPDYWDEVNNIVGSSPSTLRITLPEIYLGSSDEEERIKKINSTMKNYLDNDMFTEYKDSMIYLERTQNDGKVREGLIGMVDLEDYSYEKGSQTLIRATEKTVIERIPPRMKVRENALLELPHIMILIDDPEKNIIESLKHEVTNEDMVYNFDLMQKGGHIKGYKLSKNSMDSVISKLESLADQENFDKKYTVSGKGVLLFAMGDGNHSLATAKACYEKLKETMSEEEYLNHPARYALVELVNLHSSALEFEPIHRVIFNTNPLVYCPVTEDYNYVEECLDNILTQTQILAENDGKFPNGEDGYNARVLYGGGVVANSDDKGSSLIGDGLAGAIFSFPDLKTDKTRTRIIIFATDNDVSGNETILLKDACALCYKNNINMACK